MGDVWGMPALGTPLLPLSQPNLTAAHTSPCLEMGSREEDEEDGERAGGGGGCRGRSQRLASIPVESWPGDFAQGSPSIFPRQLAAPGLSRRRLHKHERSARPAPHFAGDILAKKKKKVR